MSEPNHLIHEKSPYLLQHAYNPVDWYPWSEEAFEKAQREDKPIFLSIGYSTCHWCHVMERESFEDEEVAELLNDSFVSIKVDREERPDIDHIYMAVCQGLTGQGGWPLTVIMTPEKKPFFAGTYFPKHSMYGRNGLTEILNQVSQAWYKERDKVLNAGEKITEALQTQLKTTESGKWSDDMLDQAYQEFRSSFDSRYGGFGGAPKFPRPHDLMFLLRYWKQKNEPTALEMVEKTLNGMVQGGIWDHIGFGFARYAVDEKWLVPHFEKMLYDNALLAYTFVETYQATGKDLYAQVAQDIFTYVLRDMTHPEGGFYSAEDADSEGEEGKFYLWTPTEVEEVLGQEEGALFCECLDITPGGNFEGKSIPNRLYDTLEEVASRHELSSIELKERLESSRRRLFDAREKRIHPHKDDKVLTSWNGLMIAALARGARALGVAEYAQAAEKAVEFLFRRLQRKDGRLLARYREGESALLGYVDDYAFLVWGLLELYEATFRPRYLREAIRLSRDMLDLFGDKEAGGLFFYGTDGEQLLTRTKEVYDGATPSGNSVAALNLLRLARITGEPEWSREANRQLEAFAGSVSQTPMAFSFYLTAIHFVQGESQEIVIAGRRGEKEAQEMLRYVQSLFLPDAVVLFREEDRAEELRELVPYTAEQKMMEGKATAYVCRNYACQAPITMMETLQRNLT
ncbi:thioredoxin domain-containing protein [Kroppenstedtia pulmonis]|uniref:Thioredoxin domain-containing protein n=2 Tax=Kroppenstedtia pulmonis TaxID=1380685 RepID=A0A7D4CQD8_9BACL|nr:thioredoxin domain-containing protein [Kroppenstedtia pulmonis]